MITAELVLLFTVYLLFVLALLIGDSGAVNTFKDNLPKLSARIEKHVVTGYGFAQETTKKVSWTSP